MIKLTITSISRFNKTSKAGKPYVSVSLKAQEYGEQFIGGFGNKANETWQAGNVVEVADVTTKEFNGKKYLNFEMPKATNTPQDPAILGKILLNLGNIDRKIDQIMNHISGRQRMDLTSAGEKVPDFSEVDNKELESLDNSF